MQIAWKKLCEKVCLKQLTTAVKTIIMNSVAAVVAANRADMAELADALDSGSNDREVVEVQVLLSAPKRRSSDRLFFFYAGQKTALAGERKLCFTK